MKATIEKAYHFSAAHHLPRVPPGHPCGRVHGHNYVAIVRLRGNVDEITGFVLDFAVLDKIVKPVIDALDHSDLNQHLQNPTSELLGKFLWDKLRSELPCLHEIEIKETEKTRCIVGGQ